VPPDPDHHPMISYGYLLLAAQDWNTTYLF
jgi:hypothetical protein